MGKSHQVRGKTVSNVRKINVKLINKKQTKLMKRGKIKPRNIKLSTTRPTLKRKRIGSGSTQNEIEAEDKGDAENLNDCQSDGLEDVIEMIDKDDLEYIKRQGKTRNPLSFTSDILSTPRQPKEEQNDWSSVLNISSEEEEEYEKKPRKSFEGETKIKHLLPIKDKYGIIPKTAVVINKEVDKEQSSCVTKEIAGKNEVSGEHKQVEVKRQLSLVELYAERKKKLTERRQKIGLLASSVVENPEENLRNLKELVLLMGEKDPEIFLSSRKLAALSLLEIFCDILPSYKIRVPTEKEKVQRVKKDIKKLRDFEERLLKLYKHYLERLEVMLLPLTRKRKRKAQNENIPCAKEKAQHQLALISVKCFCDLLVTHPEFNFRENIIYLLIPLMANRNSTVSEMCCETVQKVFRNDKLGETSLLISKQMSKMMKGRNYEVPPKVMQTLLSLNVRECDLKSQEKTNEKKTSNKNQQILSRRERKRKKRMMNLEKELLETEADENKVTKARFQTDILNQIFFLYFKILKNKSKSPILTPVLEGISKFAHLINIEFFDDLVSCFGELVEKGELDGNEMLLCMHTVFTVLSGQGVALNIDPQRFYSYLYRILLSVNAGKTAAYMPILFKCLDVMLLKRKKQLTHHRVLAFLKRLCTVSLQTSHEGTLGILAVVRTMMQSHKRADILLDHESSGGSGVYLPTLEEPEHCNASSTALWELKFLQRHYHPVVVEYSNHILHGCPVQGKGHLSPALAAESPDSLLQQYETSLMKLNPQLSKSRKVHNVGKHHILTSLESLISQYSNILERCDNLSLKEITTLKS